MGNNRRTDTNVLIMGGPGGNYCAEVIRQGCKLPPGGQLYHVDIYHDDWCGMFSGRTCDCDPDIVIRPDLVESER